MRFKQILKGLIAAAIAVFVASNTAHGIAYDSAEAFLVAVLLLGVFNIFLKPLLMLFSLPFIVLTFGLGILIINALLFYLVSSMVSGFYVESFLSALWGAVVLGFVNLIANIYFGDPANRQFKVNINRTRQVPNGNQRFQEGTTSRQPKASIKDDDDVIDI